ncbi:hypothetical protein H9P43_008695 [Blastocladiella emersonii ATCC 22665]|nr:hypothetical protein H9P43_008695 [Blastocladiella emersonii ATCC 22665]
MQRVTLLGAGFLFVFTAFNVAESRITTIFPEQGFNCMAIVYFFFIFSSILAPYITNSVPHRIIFFVSSLFYALFIVSLNFDVVFLFICSALIGCAAGALWVTQGYYVSVAASSFGVDVGKLSGRFLLVSTANMIAGNGLSLLLLLVGLLVKTLLYVMAGVVVAGSLLLAMLPDPRPKQTALILDTEPPQAAPASFSDQLRRMARLLTTTPLASLIPVIMWNGSINCLAFGNFPTMLPRDAPVWLLPTMCIAFGVVGTLASPVWGKLYDSCGPMPLVAGAFAVSSAAYGIYYVAVLVPDAMSPAVWIVGMAMLGALDNVTNCLINFCLASWFGDGPDTAAVFAIFRALFCLGFMLLALLNVDTHYTIPEVKSAVDALVEEELQRSGARKMHPDVARLPKIDLFADRPALAADLARVSTGAPVPADGGIDLSRYTSVPDVASLSTPADYSAAYDYLATLLEHQSNRVANLELLGVYGANAWLYHVHQADAAAKRAEAAAAVVRDEVTRMNVERKTEQTGALDRLQRAHIELLQVRAANVNTLVALAHLEAELERRRAEGEGEARTE